MLRLCLLLLTFTAAFSKLAYRHEGSYSLSRSTANCYFRNNIQKVVMRLLDTSGNLNSNFHQNFIYLLDSGVETVDTIVEINDSFDPEKTCNNIAHFLPPGFDGSIWLDTIQSTWKRKLDERIDYLANLTSICQQRGFKVGILASPFSWNIAVGYQSVWHPKLANIRVWYQNDNERQNFNDFEYARFGKWAKPTMKEFTTTAAFCSDSKLKLSYFED